ncbi:MAG: glycosyltransferase [Flammeovirgaceae bacterium]
MNTCLIIPCFNEAERIQLDAFAFFLKSNQEMQLCFVDDGSTDATVTRLQRLVERYPNRILIVKLDENVGKGEAIRRGAIQLLEWTQAPFIGYFDADLSTPLEEAIPMLFYLKENQELKLVLGSRIKRMGAKVERNEGRHYIGRVFATFASMLLNLPVYDTQCGAKLFRRSLVNELFQEKFLSRWLFDIEIIARMIRVYGRENMASYLLEHPLQTWIEKGNSKIRWMDVMKVPFKLWQVYYHYFRRNK